MRRSRTALLILICAAQFAPVHGQGTPPAKAPTTRPGIDALIEQLGDHRFSVRDRATSQLAQMPPTDLDELVRRYREEPRHEQKLRLRYAIESVYYRRLMAGQVGFLGVTLAPRPLAGVYDPQTGQMVECIAAEGVLKDNAAARCGIRPKDMILEFDGQPIAKFMGQHAQKIARRAEVAGVGRAPIVAINVPDPETEAFMSHVKMREPGTQIPMRVLREGEPRIVHVPVGDKPEAMVAAGDFASTVLYSERVTVLGYVAGGLVIIHVPDHSWMSQAELKVNDVIAGIDGQPVQPGATAAILDQAFRATSLGRGVALEVRPLEQHALTVTLGARAPNLMNLSDWVEAQDRLAIWWRDELGEPSVRFRRPYLGYFFSSASGDPSTGPEVIP